ncbi:3'-5' exonuclease [Paeniglutamicibacter terrestris]|uniref:DNA 3'-5' helicase n=1 Tax=Paeniglutamicibacter terrestris TaxID=2723403 RepID=A0ABX1G0Y9_9MICC|nr:3'-5' exonuclease [Paeniglutamicibacter terrestris]NKG19882.1 AAA family ATPase [Paeniglutamicibacter terrestris]
MPGIVFAKTKDKLDNSVKSLVMNFLEKLQSDDTTHGLNIEPLKNVSDPRVRTGRVNDMWRAVLFKLNTASAPTYVYYGTWPHDKAIDIAQRSVLQMNPVFGIPEIIEQTMPENEEERVESQGIAKEPFAEPSVPRTELTWTNGLAEHGYKLDFLIESAGLDPIIARKALLAPTAQAFHKVTDKAPDWQGLLILDLASGKSLDESKEDLGLIDQRTLPEELEQDKHEDDVIADGFGKDAAKLQFAFIGDTPDALRDVIEGGSADAWRTFLHPEQRRYADGSWNGPFRLSGGAGTGKTVVILHRAKTLAERNPAARIIVTTFTRTLATSLNQSLRKLDSNLQLAQTAGTQGTFTCGVDSLVSQVFNSATPDERKAALKEVFGEAHASSNFRPSGVTAQQWKDALESTDHGLDPELANPTFLEQEYISVVLANFVASRDAYVKVPRVGRGTALTRPKRLGVWKIFEAFRQEQRVAGNISFPELAAVSAVLLRHRTDAGKPAIADHVLIDEAQDLHAAHWLFLRALAAPGQNDLFIAEDSHQRIYGQKVPLSRYGIAIVGRSRRLSLNYRTTAQNLAYAVRLLKGAEIEDFEGTPEEVNGYHSARSGPNPSEAGAASLADELDDVQKHITKWLDQDVQGNMIGIIARTKYQLQKLQSGMAERKVEVRDVDHPGDGTKPLYMTMHRAKGMEFFKVILFGVNEGAVPLSLATDGLAEAEKNDALLRERSLLYVAATRARDELVVSWSGNPSGLLPAASGKVSAS